MKLEEVTENLDIIVKPLNRKGNFITEVSGTLPSGEFVDFTVELIGCTTDQLINDTLQSKLEEILSCKYHYEFGNTNEEDLHYDGGTFK